MTLTPAKLIRWAGASLMAAGLLFILVQLIHPAQVMASVVTEQWALAHFLTLSMCLLGLLGITGLYARQVERAGWLGLIGFLLVGLWLALTLSFVFLEAVCFPVLASEAPQFVSGLLAMVDGQPTETALGALPLAWILSALLYLVGGLVFGIALFRARVVSRGASALYGLGSVAALLFAFLPHELGRLAAVPVGLGLTWLGWSLWSERPDVQTASSKKVD